MSNKKELEWNVFRYNINKNTIETFNIFNHYRFYKDLFKLKKRLKKESDLDFIKEVKALLMYYFWCKSEYELLLSPWVGGDREKDTIKIDIYTQVIINLDKFCEYILNNIDLLKDIK